MKDSGLMTNIRDSDEPPVKITREIPITWLIGIVCAVLFWAGTQWVQYSRLIATSEQQGKLIGDLTLQIVAMADKLDTAKMKNLEQDFTIANMKQRMDALEVRVERNTSNIGNGNKR